MPASIYRLLIHHIGAAYGHAYIGGYHSIIERLNLLHKDMNYSELLMQLTDYAYFPYYSALPHPSDRKWYI
jgi:hypothetical protein